MIRLILACLTAGAVLVLGACGNGDSESGDPGSANPDSKLTEAQATAPLKGASPQLAAIRKQANQVIDDGDAFQQQLDSLKAAGIPVVVNKWASWCGPCREEFPYFQSAATKYGDKVAFIGLNSSDGPDTANTFLAEFPVPYPSYEDPSLTIARSIDADVGFPNTIFIDASGKTVYRQLGPFESAKDLSADIEKYLE